MEEVRMDEARMEEARMEGRMEATKGGRERGAWREFERRKISRYHDERRN